MAHNVGAGKTYVMIAAGKEMRRMGLSKKNMYVVPNNLVGQWNKIFRIMYPKAKILCVNPKNFKPDKREGMLKRIRDEAFDGIIIAYSCFEKIPLSKKYYIEKLKEKMDDVSNLVNQKGKATSELKKKKNNLKRSLSELTIALNDMKYSVYFDELGINRLFVDEAHNFKNVPFETKANCVLGINSNGSKKCQDMMDKVHIIQKKNNGEGVIFATGTPITNSITDVYIMQKYLQSGELSILGLQSFDAWVGMFAERSSSFEIDVDTSKYRLATRFSKFHNLPELSSLLSLIADFHQVDVPDGIPTFDNYTDSLISKTPELESYLNDISCRAENVHLGMVSRTEDNMLKITTDGRKAALDLRLVDPTAKFSIHSKIAKCVENVTYLYFKYNQKKATQLIFCDTSTPKSGFNVYDDLKNRLVDLGIPEKDIAYIHDADTEAKRTELFLKVRSGDIRILIGSTFKLGLGVNVQDKLIGLHHLDVPWRPADMIQREGRILRQGNMNKKVFIYRYITEGSFDAYSWQLLETKQYFISELLSGSLTNRSSADIEDTILNYAEVKALAIGNPLLKQRVEAANELTKYLILQRKLVDSRIRMGQELMGLPEQIRYQKELISKCEEDLSFYKNWKKVNPPAKEKYLKKVEIEERKVLRKKITFAVKHYILETKSKKIMTYRGFDIVLPSNMTSEKLYIWLVRNGKYYVELGDVDVGNLMRIDRFLDSLDAHLEKLEFGLNKLIEKENDIKTELAKDENYIEQIDMYKEEVARLDKKLGV